MPLAFNIAWRNLWRHRGHSLVIGTILFLGALLMTTGNGVVSGMDRGLQKTIVNSFTGDLVIIPKNQESDNVFLEMMGRPVEPLKNYAGIEKALGKHPLVENFLPIGKNMAMALNEDGGMSTFHYLLGVDFERYRRMFPGTLDLMEGRFPESGEPGLLLPKGARKEIFDQTGIWFLPAGETLDSAKLEGDAKEHPGDLSLKSSMVMLGFNQDNSTTDVRLNVDGVFRYRALNNIFGTFILMDIESYRQCLGYFLASERTRGVVSPEDSALLAMEKEGLDDLFNDASFLVEGRPAMQDQTVKTPPEEVRPTGNTDLDQGAYNLVLVLLKSGVQAGTAQSELNALFKSQGHEVRAVAWKKSLGPVGSMATLIKSALFIFVSFLFLVAVIIIINTLSMAALERTPEIGMMRAIGAQKGFVSRMFLAETGVLSLFFGGLGIAAGTVIVEIISLFNISSDNDMLQLFFGGDTFRPVLAAPDFLLTIFQLAMVSLTAVLYPLLLARKVTPLEAVYRSESA